MQKIVLVPLAGLAFFVLILPLNGEDHQPMRQVFIPHNPNTSTGSHLRNNTVKAWSVPTHNVTKVKSPETFGPYEADMLTALVRNYHDHSTTNDPKNEVYYTRERIGDNVWFNVERVAPFKMFMDWARNTTRILDRSDENRKSMISQYGQNTDSQCAPETAFKVPEDVIMTDLKNRRLPLDSQIHQWVRQNAQTPIEQICNKFRGLTCNPSKKLCECESRDNTVHFVTYTRAETDKPTYYRDGCYVKPWHKCTHLSMDGNIPAEYKSYHAHPSNMKQFLLRLATPLPRTARCEKGSYCVDMILNQRRPICWCSSRMYNKDCYNSPYIPLLDQFLEIRKRFHQMMIPERDQTTRCTLDASLDKLLLDIMDLMDNVQANYPTILKLMKAVVGKGTRGAKICDFRKGLACEPYRKVCSYRSSCGPGRVSEAGLDFGSECRINNGYPCPTIEMECISGSECKDFGQGRHCHCSVDRYGDHCRFVGATFFSSILQSRISGFTGYHFANLQELMNHVLSPVERQMSLKYGDKCNPSLDKHAMTIVRYMGSVRLVSMDLMDQAISAIQYLVGLDEPLCNYRRFLGCTAKSICEPMIPDVIEYEVKTALDYPGRVRIFLSLRPLARCYGPGNYSNIPPIYHDIIHVQCLPYHQCRKVEGKTNSRHKYCLCPVGYQGLRCKERITQARNVEVYEITEPMLMMPVMINNDDNNQRQKHIDIIHED